MKFEAFLLLPILFGSANAAQAQPCDRYASDLAEMASIDQALRAQWGRDPFPSGARSEEDLPKIVQMTITADRVNTRRLQAWVKSCGWPARKRYGEKAGFDAWLLIQHSPDTTFQKQVLKSLEAGVKGGAAPQFQMAYLADRIAVHEHKPQRYGTQLAIKGPCAFDFEPMDDRAKVQARRRALGMPGLDAYKKQVYESMPACRRP